MGQTDDGAHDLGALVVRPDLVHKSKVDLQRIDGKPAQVTQRGIARAEVIDSQADALRFEPGESVGDLVRVLHQHAFTDLEHETRRVQAGRLEDLFDLTDQIPLQNLAGR